MDQNLLNALFIDMSSTKQSISARHLLSLFDKNLQFVKMMTTNLMMFNMPELTRQYGTMR